MIHSAQKYDNYYIAKVLRKFEHADGAHYDALLEAFKCFLAGKKYEYALGSPNVNTTRRVLYTYITCLYVP